jgi:2-polyprenyl-6-methoxyphenol hydroxylase-like FAD-dependent oxidoreductase
MTTERAPAVVLGGGVAGLATARLLTRHVPEVVVIERDARSDVEAPDAAYGEWERGGAPQFHHSHAFLARLRLSLLAHFPDVLDLLREVGVREIALGETAPPGMPLPGRADDEDVVLLACRRSTFEWALRTRTLARRGVVLHEGLMAAGLVGEARDGGRPRVTGVRLEDGRVLRASLVVDALGRRSPVPAWLAAMGAPTPAEHAHETGIFYYTRFYRLRRGGTPPGTTGLVAGDLGWVKLAVFPGDGDTFSITVGAPVGDAGLRRLADPARFERFLQAFPQIAPWRAPGVSAPIHGAGTRVLAMGELRNRRRRYVDREGPLAAGLFAVGDSAYHTNPIYGRGCTMALLGAELLDEALSRHPDDPIAAARAHHAACEAQLRPFWDAAVAGDRRAGGRGSLPSSRLGAVVAMAEQAVGWFLERGMLPATRTDPHVFRTILRIFHMLEPPEHLLRDPEVLLRTMPTLARGLLGLPFGGEAPIARVPRDVALARLAG